MSRYPLPAGGVFSALLLVGLSLSGCGGDDPPEPRSPVEEPEEVPEPEPEDPIREWSAEEAAVAVIRGEVEGEKVGRLAFGELTGDGHTDALVYVSARDLVRTYVIPGPLVGDLSPQENGVATLLRGNGGFGVGDLDGDGQDDVALVQDGSLILWEYHVYLGPFGDGPSPEAPDFVLAPGHRLREGSVCDVNGDGVADLVARNHGIQVADYRMVLGPLTEPEMGDEAFDVIFEGHASQLRPGPRLICGEDLTGSGSPDLLFTVSMGPEKGVWLIEDPVWSGVQPMEEVGVLTGLSNPGYALVAPGDLTGDGYLDVFSETGMRGELYGGPFQAHGVPHATFEWRWGAEDLAPVGDLDGDGFDDLVLGMPDHLEDGSRR